MIGRIDHSGAEPIIETTAPEPGDLDLTPEQVDDLIRALQDISENLGEAIAILSTPA